MIKQSKKSLMFMKGENITNENVDFVTQDKDDGEKLCLN